MKKGTHNLIDNESKRLGLCKHPDSIIFALGCFRSHKGNGIVELGIHLSVYKFTLFFEYTHKIKQNDKSRYIR